MLIASWNVNSIRSRLERVVAWLDATRPDVLCLQETKVVDEQFPREPFAALGYEAAVYGQKAYNGVAILARNPIEAPARGFDDGEDESGARLLAATAGHRSRNLPEGIHRVARRAAAHRRHPRHRRHLAASRRRDAIRI